MSSELVQLGDVADFINGYAFKPSDWGDEGKKIIRIQNLTNSDKPYNRTNVKVPEKYLVKNNDILVSWSATLDVFEWQDDDALLNQHIFKVVPDYKKVDKQYFKFALKKAITEVLSFLRGSTMKHINRGDFLSLKIPLPPLPEQQRIADILDKAEAIKQKREQALALCDEFLRATFLDMFGDPVSNPKGWDVKKLSRFGEVITGSTPSRGKPEYYGNHIEWIKSDNINTPNNYITRAEEFLSVEGESVGRSVPENSILMTCIAGSLDCIGNIALTDRKVSFNQQINGIVPNDDVDVYFLYSLLLYSKKYIQNHSTNSMKGMISKGKLSEIKFYLPEMAIQKEFSDIFLKIESLRNKIQNAQELPLFDALSQQAFKGELTQ